MNSLGSTKSETSDLGLCVVLKLNRCHCPDPAILKHQLHDSSNSAPRAETKIKTPHTQAAVQSVLTKGIHMRHKGLIHLGNLLARATLQSHLGTDGKIIMQPYYLCVEECGVCWCCWLLSLCCIFLHVRKMHSCPGIWSKYE